MTQYNSLNVKLSISQLNKLESAIKTEADVIDNSEDETNFPHKLLLTNTQVANLCKAFVNNALTVIKLSKAQLTKIQKGGFLRVLAAFLKS